MRKIFALVVTGLLLVCCAHGQENDAKVAETGDSAWLKHFYLHPDDKPFDVFWKKVVKEKSLEDAEKVSSLMGFISQVLHRYPALIQGRMDALGQFDEKERNLVCLLLWQSDTKEGRAVLEQNGKAELAAKPPLPIATWKITDAGDLDYCWGYYFATGDTKALDPIISALDWGKYAGAADKYKTSQKTAADGDAALKDVLFQAAMWSLGANGREDAGVLGYMEKVFADPQAPKGRVMWVGVILSKVKPEKYKLEVEGKAKG